VGNSLILQQNQICFAFVYFSDDKDELADPNIIFEGQYNETSKSDKDIKLYTWDKYIREKII
jgi:hypothetical protein